MIILSVNDYLACGGAKVYADTTKKALEKRGHEVFSFSVSTETSKKGKDYVYQTSKNALLRYAFGVLINPLMAYKLHKTIKETKPDIIHLHNIDRFPASLLVPLIGKKAKVVRTIHDYGFACPTVWCVKEDSLEVCKGKAKKRCKTHCITLPQLLVYKWLFWLKHRLYKKVINEYIAPSKLLIKYLESFGMTPISYIPHFVEKNEQTGIQPQKNSVLYVGELSSQKGVAHLIIATKLVKREIPDIKLTIIGDGEQKRYLKEMIKDVDMEKNVTFKGMISHEQVLKEYKKHSLVVIPSLWMEQFCLVGLEASVCGTPVLASKIGGIPDWLVEGKNGFFIKRRNAEDIAEKMIKSLKSVELRENAKNYAKELEQKFSKQKHIRKLEKVFFK